MSENPFKRNPQGNAVGILETRSAALKGGHSGFYKVGTRHPAWVSITGEDRSCNGGGSITLPLTQDNLLLEYDFFNELKPNPIISDVTIEYGGDFGLATSLSVKILCFTKYDFERIQKYFLQPGNRVSVSFGYGPAWTPEFGNDGGTIDDMIVASYAFSTTSDGGWEANFTAVSMCTGLQDIDLGAGVFNDGGGLKYLAGGKSYPVRGVLDLIASDAQLNGSVALDVIPKPGKTIKKFKQYTPSDADAFGTDKNVAMVVYTPEHLQGGANTSVQKDQSLGSGDTGPNTYNAIYVTLGYLVDRIFNGEIHKNIKLRICKTDKELFEKVKIYIDPILSVSYVDPTPEVYSGNPTAVLILGGTRANYKNSSGKGKNFEEGIGDITPMQAYTGKSAKGRNIIDLGKILISRNLIKECLDRATSTPSATADTTDVKNGEEQVISFNTFFKEVFGAIKTATGGMIDMRLVEEWRAGVRGTRYVIMDQNNGYATESLTCVVFNPIDGDGSTRNCTVSSGAGGKEMKAQMFSGSSRKSVSSAHARGCDNELVEARKQALGRAAQQIGEIVINPGALADSGFAEDQELALKSQLEAIAKNAPEYEALDIHPYPGVQMSIELDGVFGFTPGCAMMTTQMPSNYFNKKLYFMIRKVSHSIKGSDWSTTMEGILAVGDVKYEPRLGGYES